MLEFKLYKGCFWNILKKMNRSTKSHIPYDWLWIILKICQFWWKMDQLGMELSYERAPFMVILLLFFAKRSRAVQPGCRPPAPLPETLYWDAQQKQANWTHNHCCFPTKQVDTLKPWRIDWGNTFKWSGVSFIIVLHYINNIEQKSSCWGLILCRPLSSIPVAWGRFRTFSSFSNMHS